MPLRPVRMRCRHEGRPEHSGVQAGGCRPCTRAARDGIKQLQENEDVYLNGVGTYEAGLIQLSSGKSALNAGYKEYYAGKKALEEGKKAYAEGVKALEAGKKEYEAGKKKIAENTQAYNEGKEKLAKIEPLMPYLNQYVQFRDGTIAKLPGFNSAQAWFVKTVRPIAAKLGITIPDDVTDFPAFMNKMVADGKAQLKEYEDGVAKLAEAEKTIAAGEKKLAAAEKEIAAGEKKLADAEKQLAAGEKKLAAGKNELANGDKKLKVYEGGQEQLAAGMQQLLDEMVPCTTRSGKQTVPGLKELLGDDFSIWVLNDKGEVKVERGCQFVDLDNCTKLCDEAEHYLELQEADIKSELYPRIAMNIMMALAAIIGIVSGIVAIVGAVTGSKKTGFIGGIITAVLAVAANIVGIVVGYTDFVYQTRELPYGNWFVWLIIIGASGSDTFAYLTGMLIGRHHFSELSPKKTIEGCVGGVLGTAVLALVYSFFLPEGVDTLFGVNVHILLLICGAVCSIVSQIGDLAASAIKRNYGIKDYSNLIPGHGGIMDRFDSILFTAPLVYYMIQLFIA